MWREIKSLSHWISRAHQLFVLSMHFKALLVPRWITFNQRWAIEVWVLCFCSIAPQGRRKAWSTHLNQVFLPLGWCSETNRTLPLTQLPVLPLPPPLLLWPAVSWVPRCSFPARAKYSCEASNLQRAKSPHHHPPPHHAHSGQTISSCKCRSPEWCL